MRLETLPILNIGQTPNGQRRIGLVKGGTIVGERVQGKVLSGNDWQMLRPDRSLTLDVRLVFEAGEGTSVTMSYRGMRHGPKAVIERLERGEVVDPESYYFRIAPMFEVGAGELRWVNDIQAVGVGHRFPDGPVYSVFEVL